MDAVNATRTLIALCHADPIDKAALQDQLVEVDAKITVFDVEVSQAHRESPGTLDRERCKYCDAVLGDEALTLTVGDQEAWFDKQACLAAYAAIMGQEDGEG
jgi:hypothetical protein